MVGLLGGNTLRLKPASYAELGNIEKKSPKVSEKLTNVIIYQVTLQNKDDFIIQQWRHFIIATFLRVLFVLLGPMILIIEKKCLNNVWVLLSIKLGRYCLILWNRYNLGAAQAVLLLSYLLNIKLKEIEKQFMEFLSSNKNH